MREIAVNLHWHPVSVRRLLRRFNREGLEGLRPRKRTGRPALESFVSETALSAVLDLARQSPQHHGLSRPVWTSDALAEEAFQRGFLPFRVPGKRLRRMLARQGHSWKLVKSWLTSPDPDYEEKRGA